MLQSKETPGAGGAGGTSINQDDAAEAAPTVYPTEKLKAALGLAQKGLPVFPCNEDKKPITKLGFRDVSTEEAVIRKWWGDNPGALIGIPTGAATGLAVLDIDIDESKGLDGRKALADS